MIGHMQVQHIMAGKTNTLERAHGSGGRGSAREEQRDREHRKINHRHTRGNYPKVWTKHGIHMEKRDPVKDLFW